MFKRIANFFKKTNTAADVTGVRSVVTNKYSSAANATFDPKTVNRWVLHVDGLDSFLVLSTQLPKIVRDTGSVLVTHMSVTYHEIHGISIFGAVKDWMVQGAQRHAIFRYVNTVCQVTESWTMDVTPVSVEVSQHSYENSRKCTTTTVIFNVENLNIEVAP